MQGGGLAPFIAEALVGWGGGEWTPVGVYMRGCAAITLASAFIASETKHRLDEP